MQMHIYIDTYIKKVDIFTLVNVYLYMYFYKYLCIIFHKNKFYQKNFPMQIENKHCLSSLLHI